MKFSTIPEMFWTNVERFAGNNCLGYKKDGVWKTLTFQEVGQEVERVSRGLHALGISGEDKVSILSENSPRWAIADYGILSLSAINVPVYPTLIPKQIQYILNNGDVKVLFAENEVQTKKVLEIFNQVEQLTHIIVMDNSDIFEEDYVITWDELISRGNSINAAEDFNLKAYWQELQPDDLLTLIYTSGTTGAPKGVMLTHRSLTSNIEASLQRVRVGTDDRFLSFLPLSHSFERMAGHFLPTTAGSTIYYAESIETVADNMGEVHPTVMTSVPRLYEKMYMKVNEAAQQGSAIKRKIFAWAIKVGQEYKEKQKAGPVGGGLKFRYNLAHNLVFSKLHERVGGELRFFVSGGAPLSPEIGRFFESAGILILEGYGLTETSPVISVNEPESYKIGTVGQPLENVEVQIAVDGEILTRGPHVMRGYYKNEEATTEAIDEEGWFHTGDVGELDHDNFLKITDRKKNLIVTSGGKNVAPQPLEGSIANSQYVEQVILIGDKRKFVSAVIVPTFEALEAWADKENIQYTSREDLVEQEQVYEFFEEEVERQQADFARYEKVKKFLLLPSEFTIEDGTLTPKLSIKRHVVEERFKEEIDALYEE
ncbi:MAG: long-chain fatty acid--CoA ligase [Candidatus Marinimicrobia bacterium]|nr:long-chain fatty acid--CoA ligase [Candidatus Neomarinimicrobiota bacterium]MCF7828255.1 long-chain fatty acid--CoA ligase [Candidatus Neomarinimicrobiota bacterium]MCF7879570.1 long-chain fatty acid--CoA ligase [Candidatus Neomarinimicrobiota bacterium]